MGFYDQNYKKISEQLSPPQYRLPRNLSWFEAILYPLQWLRDLIFFDYASGTDAERWDSLTAYVYSDRVIYQGMVYEALQGSTGVIPSENSGTWLLVLEDFRGVYERVSYNGQKLVMEYLLNRWFFTTFIQPDHNNPSNRSDIFIDTLPTDDDSFMVGASDEETSYVPAVSDFSEDFVGVSFDPATINLQVNYPLSLIPTTSDDRYKQMVFLVEKYKVYGATVSYVGY